MTDKSAFTDDEWHALAEAPLHVTLAMVAVGQHGPISMVKEMAASAREMAKPGDRGAATALIAEIASAANTHEARHDLKAHHDKTPDAIVDTALTDLAAVATSLAKLSTDEATQVRAWLLDIAHAVAAAAKEVSPAEQQTIDRIAAALGAAQG
jgi:hypothetical protein